MIGITGSIGAGKSLVGAILRERKIRVIDADVAVHHLYRDNQELRSAIAAGFGADMLTEKGISRGRMAKLVFKDPSARLRLESLVYPVLTDYLLRANPAFVEAALFENVPKLVEHLDEIWVVTASEGVRLKRLMEKRGFSEKDARCRIELQRSRDSEEYWQQLFPGKRLRFIDNTLDEDHLRTQIEDILKSSSPC
jgi:dephospho-CoA kinase